MTAIRCRQCGKDFEASGKGPRPLYCSDRCRQSAHRGVAPAAKAVADVPMPTPVTSTASQRNYGRGLGDGDDCPQDRTHGAMYFMKPGTRQWCPSSLHKGDPFYAHDGVTPAPRSAAVIPTSGGMGASPESDQPLIEAPASDFPGASLLREPPAAATGSPPQPASRSDLETLPVPGTTTHDVGRSSPFPGVAAVQLGLPLAQRP